jgi:4-hydroxy-tetrahydrodipicolinate synthase
LKSGCYTAIATPFSGDEVDYDGLNQLVDYQIESGIAGIIAVGTTGESPTLSWQEHNQVIKAIADKTRERCLCVAGTGSNNTLETLEGTRHAAEAGVDAVLLVDPYYNGPSSQEIRKEYVAPVAKMFPQLTIIPYVIPGRTGAQLLPEDLAFLYQQFPNVSVVKEATGNLENMRRTRRCCGPAYTILSGDDGMTFDLMTDPLIRGAGVISVVSNLVPKAMVAFVQSIIQKDLAAAKSLLTALEPLFGLVVINTMEQTPHGEALCRARNPLGLKTMMSLLGMPSGHCRPPLGRMSRNGLDKVLEIGRKVQANNPEILQPIADRFGVDIEARLNDPAYHQGLCYDTYE